MSGVQGDHPPAGVWGGTPRTCAATQKRKRSERGTRKMCGFARNIWIYRQFESPALRTNEAQGIFLMDCTLQPVPLLQGLTECCMIHDI